MATGESPLAHPIRPAAEREEINDTRITLRIVVLPLYVHVFHEPKLLRDVTSAMSLLD